ncbi:TPA: L-aspartate oxidase [Candidatus Poribacteria bacterium]|nr:L-aspartate oxidase [Candidatus Poribacteria bacterium]
MRKYIVNFDSTELPKIETDFLIIGSGNAGLRAAIEASQHGNVIIITKDILRESSTRYAQGGIAVAMSEEDTIAAHVADTLRAGADLCDEHVVKVMVEEGIPRVKELIKWGANFDQRGGQLGFTREAAHGRRRIIHARGDATGEETEEVLMTHATNIENVRVMEYTYAIDLLSQDNVCYGALVLSKDELGCIFAKATILAAGGLGQIYKYTSNPKVATGDGFAMAFRAGCEMMDMEFVQFHPTTLFLTGAPRFLISESVRGEGGILKNAAGERFMPSYHEMAELAPRDVVSRAILQEMRRTKSDCVYLDVTHLKADFIKKRFPTINKTCASYGVDITEELIPVQSAAHFMMGGVKTDIKAATNLKGLYACGEVACTGVHGANRLASNSLLEGLVFGARAGKYAAEYAKTVSKTELENLSIRCDIPRRKEDIDINAFKSKIQNIMWERAGIVRDGEGLTEAKQELERLAHDTTELDKSELELQNMLQTAQLIVQSAFQRTESRGGHYRIDYPERDDVNWNRHLIFISR